VTTDSDLAAWVGAAATLLAVVIALFKEEIVRLWRRPKLTARVLLAAPDCHLTEIVYTVYAPAFTVKSSPCYYFRIWIENEGRQRATQVQVFASKLERRQADGSYRQVAGFLPMNLRWAHGQTKEGGPEIFADGISPKMGKHCDLGHIVDPKDRKDLGQDLQGVPPNQTVLGLDLEVQPNTLSHLLQPGVYHLTVRIAASNANPVTKVIELNHTGDWFPGEQRMFSDGFGMHEVK